MWEIIDDNGTIFSGSQEDMEGYWDCILNNEEHDPIHSQYASATKDLEWDGDIRLIQIIATTR